MQLQVSSIHWGQRWSLKAVKRAHSPQTLVIVDTSFGTFQSVHVTFCLKYKTSGWKSEHRKMLRIFTIVSSNKTTRGSIIQPCRRRKVLDLCHTRDLNLNLAHGMQETHNLKAREQGLIAYRTYLGDWPYQREDSCHFSITIEQIDKSESHDVCQQLPPGKTWQAPFLWPTFSAGLGTTYNLSAGLKILPNFFSTKPPF